jgi:hypothetical protein
MSIGAILHVLNHSKALQSYQTILVQLANHANDAGVAWPSVATLAAKTGYKRKWIEAVLAELETLGEYRREKVWRGYRYQLYVYDTKKKTCSCALIDHDDQDTADHGQLIPIHGQLLLGHGQLVPSHGQSSVANSTSQNGNASEPVFDPCSEPRYTHVNVGNVGSDQEEAEEAEDSTSVEPVADLVWHPALRHTSIPQLSDRQEAMVLEIAQGLHDQHSVRSIRRIVWGLGEDRAWAEFRATVENRAKIRGSLGAYYLGTCRKIAAAQGIDLGIRASA